MLIRPSAIVLSIAALAVAAPEALEVRQVYSCNTGSVQCCTSLQSASTYAYILEFLGVDVSSLTGQVGLTCSPVTGGGSGEGSSCTSQPACCTGNSINGLFTIGCSPITVNG